MYSSIEPTRELSHQIHGLEIACSRASTSRMCPVSPMPPTVAQKSSGSRVGLHSTISSDARRILSAVTCWPKQPSRWWFLPCTSDATMPPMVTNLVPGVTGVKKPRGMLSRFISARLKPASARRIPLAGSNPSTRSASRVPTTLCAGAAGRLESP